VFFIGDSIAHEMAEALAHSKNFAANGSTWRDMVLKQLPELLKQKSQPDLLVVCCGANDGYDVLNSVHDKKVGAQMLAKTVQVKFPNTKLLFVRSGWCDKNGLSQVSLDAAQALKDMSFIVKDVEPAYDLKPKLHLHYRQRNKGNQDDFLNARVLEMISSLLET